MTRIIYKYAVPPTGVIVAAIDQKVVLVGIDPKLDEICVWVEQSLGAGDATRVQYLVMGTGFGMEDDESFHAGSCITPDGFVWHVYGKVL